MGRPYLIIHGYIRNWDSFESLCAMMKVPEPEFQLRLSQSELLSTDNIGVPTQVIAKLSLA